MQQYIDSYDFKGKRAIVRVDFNVPLNENFEITDDTRIRRAIPTLKKVLEGGGSLILMSHLGRPKKVDPKFSLKYLTGRVSELLGVPVQFAEDWLTISCMEMENFILATCSKNEHLRCVEEFQCHYKGGDIVRVVDGAFKGVVGRVARVSGQQRVIVSLTNVGLISTAYIPTAFIQAIEPAQLT